VLVSSAVPMGALWCGVQRVGAANASIIASVEPAITVTLAALLLGEHLRDVQLLGGGLVVGAVVLLNARRAGAAERSGSVRSDEPAAEPAPPAPARALAHEPA
jgi:drug/metabolite transporter (DMT)-like permease